MGDFTAAFLGEGALLRARLCCQININAGFAVSQPIRNSLSSEKNVGVFMWIEVRNFSSSSGICRVCEERMMQANPETGFDNWGLNLTRFWELQSLNLGFASDTFTAQGPGAVILLSDTS